MMKGYWTGYSYMGWVGNRYIEFVSESEYLEYIQN